MVRLTCMTFETFEVLALRNWIFEILISCSLLCDQSSCFMLFISLRIFFFSFLATCSSCLKCHCFRLCSQKCATNLARHPRLNQISYLHEFYYLLIMLARSLKCQFLMNVSNPSLFSISNVKRCLKVLIFVVLTKGL